MILKPVQIYCRGALCICIYEPCCSELGNGALLSAPGVARLCNDEGAGPLPGVNARHNLLRHRIALQLRACCCCRPALVWRMLAEAGEEADSAVGFRKGGGGTRHR